jgi:Domain of unknown function (DUF5666)
LFWILLVYEKETLCRRFYAGLEETVPKLARINEVKGSEKMIVKQRSRWKFFAVPLFVLFTTLLAACGSTSAATSNATSNTSTTAKACLTVTTGTIQSISNNSLSVTNFQGNKVQAIFTSKTTIMRQATLTSTDLKTGMLVSVTVIQNTNGTYSARAISVRNSLTNQGGISRGSGLCNGQRRRGTGTPGTFGGPGFGSGTPGAGGAQSRQIINGAVSQISGSSLTVTDTSSNDFTVTLNSTTRISTQKTVTGSDLRVGEAVMITGSANSQGVINANSVSILQGLQNRPTNPTSTTTTGA